MKKDDPGGLVISHVMLINCSCNFEKETNVLLNNIICRDKFGQHIYHHVYHQSCASNTKYLLNLTISHIFSTKATIFSTILSPFTAQTKQNIACKSFLKINKIIHTFHVFFSFESFTLHYLHFHYFSNHSITTKTYH